MYNILSLNCTLLLISFFLACSVFSLITRRCGLASVAYLFKVMLGLEKVLVDSTNR